MTVILRYFWFVLAGVMLLNITIWRSRLQPLVSDGTLRADEAARMVRGATLGLVGPCILLGVIALWAGWSDPFCAGILTFDTPPRIATSLVILSAWAALLWWVWLGRGADVLGRLGPDLSNDADHDRYAPARVRLAITSLVLVASIGSAVAWRIMPKPSPSGCAAELFGG